MKYNALTAFSTLAIAVFTLLGILYGDRLCVVSMEIEDIPVPEIDTSVNIIIADTIKIKELSDASEKPIKIEKVVYDMEGNPLENVKAWCDNCKNKSLSRTGPDGVFSLDVDLDGKASANQQILLKFKYKNQEDSRVTHYKTPNSFTPPRFNKQ